LLFKLRADCQQQQQQQQQQHKQQQQQQHQGQQNPLPCRFVATKPSQIQTSLFKDEPSPFETSQNQPSLFEPSQFKTSPFKTSHNELSLKSRLEDPSRYETSHNELSLESRLEDDFYYDIDDDPTSRHHPHEDFEPFYEEHDSADLTSHERHTNDDNEYNHHNHDRHRDEYSPKKHKHGRSKKKILFKPPFYGDIAGYNPPQGVILNPKDSIFTAGIEPGGLAGITPKFIKFLRGHVKNVGKTKKKKKKSKSP
jgi:hypothetical protein